jgi:hypothetical protein
LKMKAIRSSETSALLDPHGSTTQKTAFFKYYIIFAFTFLRFNIHAIIS